MLERSKTVYRNLEYQRDFQANMTDHWRAGKKKKKSKHQIKSKAVLIPSSVHSCIQLPKLSELQMCRQIKNTFYEKIFYY